MVPKDFHDHPKRGKIRRVRPNAKKRGHAHHLIRRLRWLDRPLVYWSGSAPLSRHAPESRISPIDVVVAEALRGRHRGLWAIEPRFLTRQELLEPSGGADRDLHNPAIQAIPVTLELVASAAATLTALSRFPVQLPRLIEDPSKWRRLMETRLNRVACAVRAASTGALSEPSSVVIEELAYWIGLDDGRSSRSVSSEALLGWMAVVGEDEPGARTAALILGQRSEMEAVTLSLERWKRLGSALPDWPPDLLVFLGTEGLARTLPSPGVRPRATAESVAAVREAAILGGTGVPRLLGGIPVLERMLDTLEEERFESVEKKSLRRSNSSGMGPWRVSLAAIYGRIASRCEDPRGIALSLSGWLERCRELCRPGPDGANAARFGVRVLEAALPYSAWDGDSLSSFLEVLAKADLFELAEVDDVDSPDDHLLRERPLFDQFLATVFDPLADGELSVSYWEDEGFRHTRMLELPALAQLRTAVADDVCGTLSTIESFKLRCNFISRLGRVIRGNPTAVPEFVAWSRAQDDRGPHWGVAKVFLLEEALRTRLLALLAPTVGEGGTLSIDDGRHALAAGVWEWCSSDDQPSHARGRQTFLRSNPWIIDRLVPLTWSYPEEDFLWLDDDVSCILSLAWSWKKEGGSDLRGLVSDLCEYTSSCGAWELAYEHEERRDPLLRFAVRVLGSRRELLLNLLRQQRLLRDVAPDPAILDPAWQRLKHAGQILTVLRAMAARPRDVPRLMELLRLLLLVVRLRPGVGEGLTLEPWPEAWPGSLPELPVELPPELEDELAQICGLRLIGGSTVLPKKLERIVFRERDLRREFSVLEGRRDDAGLTPAAEERMEKVRRLLAEPENLRCWIVRDLEREVPKLLLHERERVLSTHLREEVRSHWKRLLGTVPDDYSEPVWTNAMSLLSDLSLSKGRRNRGLLLKLLRHRAGTTEPLPQHPENLKFLTRLRERGVNSDIWTGARRETLAVGGTEWSVHIERDPLEVLQMGRLFGTCLSPGDFNAFAAVANALEANKIVLYVTDQRGRTSGRRMVGMTAKGELVPFPCYGARPYVKMVLDIFCRRLVTDCGATLWRNKNRGDDDPPDLSLFAEGYLDPPEPLDWWTVEAARINDRVELATLLRDDVLSRLASTGTVHEQPKAAAAAIRALLWLGDAGSQILLELEQGSDAHALVLRALSDPRRLGASVYGQS